MASSLISNREDLGDLCHFSTTNSVPVAVLTDLKSNIICSNEATSIKDDSLWYVSGCRIMITRFWASSSGYVILSTSADSEKIAPFPIDKLGIEREVCIWLGYLPRNRPVIPEDLGTHLLRTYVGVVDIVQSTNTGAGGYTVTLQLRDRMKWLMDTTVTYNPALDESVGEQPLRSNLILEIAQRGIGQVDSENGCSVCGKQILHNPDFYYDLGDFEKFGIERSGPLASASNSPADGRLAESGAAGNGTLKSELLSAFPDPKLAAAFYGNIMQESGGDPTIANGIGAYGLVQWLDSRRDDLNSFASSQGVPVNTVKTQVAFIKHELNGKESGALSKIQSASGGSLENLVRTIRVYYERPGEAEANDAARIAHAREFLASAGSVPAAPVAPPEPKTASQTIRDAIPGTLGDPPKPTEPINEAEIIATSEVPPANAWYIGDGTTPGPLAGSTTTSIFEVPEFPDFRIYTTRAPINLQQNTNFLINQQVPLNVIKQMAAQEIYPMEVFQDNRDGHLYYCPRANDSTGLEDPKRFYRTYFFRNYPDSYLVKDGAPDACPPDHNQMLQSFREEQASIDLKTNFIVSKSTPNAEGGSGDDWTIHLKVKPTILNGVKFACKFYKIYDETITSLEEAAVIAMNASRIMGKEVRAGTAVMLGDPSIVPGEVLQIFGSPLLPNYGMDGGYQDRITYSEFDGRYADNLKIYAEQSLKNAGVSGRDVAKGQEITLPVYDGTTATIKVEEFAQGSMDSIICENSSFISATGAVPVVAKGEEEGKEPEIGEETTTTDPAASVPVTDGTSTTPPTSEDSHNHSDDHSEEATLESAASRDGSTTDSPSPGDPPTMYRAEALLHKFNVGNTGYITEIALTIPF